MPAGTYRGGRSGAACPRSTRRRLCREPVVAAPRLFGRGRRDGRRGLPFRRRDRLCARIRWQPDPQIQQIISGGPRVLQARCAEALGFAADTGIDEAVQALIDDDLDMQKQLV
jgi:hypothetical protein